MVGDEEALEFDPNVDPTNSWEDVSSNHGDPTSTSVIQRPSELKNEAFASS